MSGLASHECISVALCTYNGARFLPQQLESILRQTRLPDEVQAFDDASTDESVALLEEFARRAQFAVCIHRNPERLGSIRNFEQAVRACTGSLIAFCDQDDVWHPERLARSEAALSEHPEAGAVFTDGLLIDDAGNPTGVQLWQRFIFTPEDQRRMRAGEYLPLAKQRFITGATMLFRAKYVPWIFPPGHDWHHDGWTSAIVAAFSGLCWVTEPMIQYRLHEGQQVGIDGHLVPNADTSTFAGRSRNHWFSFMRLLRQLDTLCETLDRLPLSAEQRATGAADAFYAERAFLATRLGLPGPRLQRIGPLLHGHRLYRRCAQGWLSILKDFALPKTGNELREARETAKAIRN